MDRPQSSGFVLEEQLHPLTRRIAHWLMVLSIFIMTGSGWRIYNSEPILPFRFPEAITLGGNGDRAIIWHNDGGVASAIAWHLAGLWLLLFSFLLFVIHGLVTGHVRRDYLPVGPRSFWRDFQAAATFKLEHHLGVYNAVQRAFYIGVLLAVFGMLASGLAIWKPVQFSWLTTLFGGFQGARIVHFLLMSAIVAFVAVHVALVLLVPKTFIAMTLGRATSRHPTAAE